MRHVAVIDIGKTHVKMALIDHHSWMEMDAVQCLNEVRQGPPYPHCDIDMIWKFILKGLRFFQTQYGIDAIITTTHGATAALLDNNGHLAAPILDYEYHGPDTLRNEYNAIRPDFAETGSPCLPLGLNLGAQLFWQFKSFPDIYSRTKIILTYPQYWAYRLSGVAVNEVTSLGCHTDLWVPNKWGSSGNLFSSMRFSSMVKKLGWQALMAPMAKATDQLGLLLPDIAEITGIATSTPIYCGIHDSNAALYRYLLLYDPPFAVISTGTWIVAMAIGGARVKLEPARDTLMNVNAYGQPVPSARFMGGREFEQLIGDGAQDFTANDMHKVISKRIILLPAVEHQSGPFQGRRATWMQHDRVMEDDMVLSPVLSETLSPGERFVTVSFYLALMTATSLRLTGAKGPIFIEGPLAKNAIYLDMLSAATDQRLFAVKEGGTSLGAGLLTWIDQSDKPDQRGQFTEIRNTDRALSTYLKIWNNHIYK